MGVASPESVTWSQTSRESDRAGKMASPSGSWSMPFFGIVALSIQVAFKTPSRCPSPSAELLAANQLVGATDARWDDRLADAISDDGVDGVGRHP
jgi:hypothetical protein